MKVLKYTSQAILAIAALYLLLDVMIVQRTGLATGTRRTLVNIAYGLFGLSAVLMTFYYYRAGEYKRFKQSLLYIAGAILLYFLLVMFS